MTSSLTLICHGARGSMPVAGSDFERFGGLTTCYEVVTRPGHRLLVDLGTGVHHLLPTLDPDVDDTFDVFFTHFHWDHTHGVPFFRPLYDARNHISFYAAAAEGLGTEELVSMLMRPPWFPVRFDETPAKKRFVDLESPASASTGFDIAGVHVRHVSLFHPSGVTAYRFTVQDKSIVLATDVESAPWSDELLIDLADGADVLIYDAQYFPDEYRATKMGWGHSTWEDAVRIAESAGVGRLVLTSHDPGRTDKGVDELVAAADEHVPTIGASVGLRIEA